MRITILAKYGDRISIAINSEQATSMFLGFVYPVGCSVVRTVGLHLGLRMDMW
jgi:hypothetical protein